MVRPGIGFRALCSLRARLARDPGHAPATRRFRSHHQTHLGHCRHLRSFLWHHPLLVHSTQLALVTQGKNRSVKSTFRYSLGKRPRLHERRAILTRTLLSSSPCLLPVASVASLREIRLPSLPQKNPVNLEEIPFIPSKTHWTHPRSRKRANNSGLSTE